MHQDNSDILSGFESPQLLKKGGQKVAYRVRDALLGDTVLKIGSYASPQALERARREVEVLNSISSPYYPRHHDFRVVSGSRFVVLEEYIPSTPLSHCLDEYRSAADALGLLHHLVSGLMLLWERRIVHRDAKPDNILIRPSKVPVIIDLGIARVLDSDSLTYSLAPHGPCTPVYAAPEQLKNQKADIDARTDQFALGIILIQLLLQGRHPHDPLLVGQGTSIMDNIIADRWHRGLFRQAELAPIEPLNRGARI